MKLSKKFDQALVLVIVVILALFLGCFLRINSASTFADGEDNNLVQEVDNKYVTFYDNGSKLIVKTDAKTVKEALDRAEINLNQGDKIEPSLETVINSNNFYINIYRARPVIVKDGINEKYLMTANYDTKLIAEEAGLTVYDGDEIKIMPNDNFLETGIANVYSIVRNGGRTITIEEEIPFSEETVRDINLESGKTEVRQLGEVGAKRVYYNVLYMDNQEVSREVISEEIIREPVNRIVAIGAKKSIPPEWGTCADWARQAGVSEMDLSAALDLIYRESGCRVDARNASSGAYGIPQALPGSKMASVGADWATNPVTQIRWMIGYVNGRYGGWGPALNFWYIHGWY